MKYLKVSDAFHLFADLIDAKDDRIRVTDPNYAELTQFLKIVRAYGIKHMGIDITKGAENLGIQSGDAAILTRDGSGRVKKG